MLKALLTLVLVGRFSQYAPGVMERVVVQRQEWGQLPQDVSEYAGFIAVLDCRDLGKEFWLRPRGGDWELFLAADCASKTDHQSDTDPRSGYQWMRDNNILAEVDGQTARRWLTVGRLVRGEMWPYSKPPVPRSHQNSLTDVR